MTDTSAMVKRLRDCANGFGDFKTYKGDFGLCDEAATALEAKDAEIKRLRGQIDYLADEARRFADFYEQGSDGRNTFVVFASKIKAALTPSTPKLETPCPRWPECGCSERTITTECTERQKP